MLTQEMPKIGQLAYFLISDLQSRQETYSAWLNPIHFSIITDNGHVHQGFCHCLTPLNRSLYSNAHSDAAATLLSR